MIIARLLKPLNQLTCILFKVHLESSPVLINGLVHSILLLAHWVLLESNRFILYQTIQGVDLSRQTLVQFDRAAFLIVSLMVLKIYLPEVTFCRLHELLSFSLSTALCKVVKQYLFKKLPVRRDVCHRLVFEPEGVV